MIGVTGWRQRASFGVWSGEMDFLEWAYVQAIADAGGVPVLVPPAPRLDAGLVSRLDGLILAGGGDIAPERYGQTRHPATTDVVSDRDEVELELGAAALEQDVPVLGICRGHQVLAVLSGGTLHQDIPAPTRDLHVPAGVMFGEHAVGVASEGRLAGLLGDSLVVNTHHHQAVDRLGADWRAVAWAPDGTIEAIERVGQGFALGIQWHPEWSEDRRLFEALVAQAALRHASGSRRPNTAPPVVGITTYHETIRVDPWEVPAAVLPNAYARAVLRAGGQPLLLPPLPGAAVASLETIDALMLTGGGDVDPARYGQAEAAALLDLNGGRDQAELDLIAGALERDTPVLGICRGHQLLNVAGGGDLIQHVPDVVGHDGHKVSPGVFAEHSVNLEPDTRLGARLGRRVTVKSHHHQALAAVAPSLRVAGRAEDGTVEAVELPTARFAAGVQWHPEEDPHQPALFDLLVEEAAAYRDGRPSPSRRTRS